MSFSASGASGNRGAGMSSSCALWRLLSPIGLTDLGHSGRGWNERCLGIEPPPGTRIGAGNQAAGSGDRGGTLLSVEGKAVAGDADLFAIGVTGPWTRKSATSGASSEVCELAGARGKGATSGPIHK